MSGTKSTLATIALLGCVLAASNAQALPSIQVINSLPTGTSPMLQTPFGWASPDFAGTQTYDGDPTQPWLIEIGNQLSPGAGTLSRLGAVGLTPTSLMTNVEFYGPNETHPMALFVGMGDSYVYRFDALTGECVWKTYIGRTTAATINFPGCAGSVAAEEIQCPNELGGTVDYLAVGANVSSDTTSADTTVYVPTDYDQVSSGGDPVDCGTTADNRLYALNAATGAPTWVFNTIATAPAPYAISDSPPYKVAAVLSGSSGDLDGDDECSTGPLRNQVFIATMEPASVAPGSQPTLFAVSTVNGALGGSLNWSGYVGDIQSELNQSFGQTSTCQHLYAATTAGGDFETIGITATACKAAAVPCILHKRAIFVLTPPIGGPEMLWGSNSLFGKVVVADQNTVSLLNDDGSLYCSAGKLSALFPVLTSAPSAFTQSTWFGASAADGSSALIGLEFPPTAPAAPFDCGLSFASLPQDGTVGFVDTDINAATGARVLYVSVAGSDESDLVIANYTE